MTEKKSLKVDVVPKVDKQDATIVIKKDLKYSPNGFDIFSVKAGRYNAKDLDPIVIKLHREGMI
jgi:hypothetical protein